MGHFFQVLHRCHQQLLVAYPPQCPPASPLITKTFAIGITSFHQMLTTLQIFYPFFTGRVLPASRDQIISRQAAYGSPVLVIGALASEFATCALLFINSIFRPLPVPIPASPLQLLSCQTDIHIPLNDIGKPVFAKHISPMYSRCTQVFDMRFYSFLFERTVIFSRPILDVSYNRLTFLSTASS